MEDKVIFQNDLESLFEWGKAWGLFLCLPM